MNDNTNPTLTLTTVIDAAKTARSHTGGRLAVWHRQMANSYTIDPHRPAPDDADLERERLFEAAKKLAVLYVEQGPAQDDYGRVSSLRYHCPELL